MSTSSWDLLLFLAGLLGGFGSSAPLGVINLWVTDATLSGREGKLRPFLTGVILMDVVYAAIAFWGYHTFLQEGFHGAFLGVAGGLFLVALGVLNMRANAAGDSDEGEGSESGGGLFSRERIGKSPWADGLLGVFMVGSNPAFLMFWVFAIKLLEDRFGRIIELDGEFAFLCGILLGDLIWFNLLVKLIRRGRASFQPRVVTRIRFGIAVAFIAFGAYAIYRSSTALTSWAGLSPYGGFLYF